MAKKKIKNMDNNPLEVDPRQTEAEYQDLRLQKIKKVPKEVFENIPKSYREFIFEHECKNTHPFKKLNLKAIS